MADASVKVWVAITPEGAWSASGWGHEDGPSNDDHAGTAVELLPPDGRSWQVYALTASVPIPAEQELPATVERAPRVAELCQFGEAPRTLKVQAEDDGSATVRFTSPRAADTISLLPEQVDELRRVLAK